MTVVGLGLVVEESGNDVLGGKRLVRNWGLVKKETSDSLENYCI